MLKFTNIKLADGKSGADRGQGLKRTEGHYVTGSNYGIGTTTNSVVNDDYYIVYNQWPSFSGAAASSTTSDVSSTDLAKIGITQLTVAAKADHVADTSLDIVIVRKSDSKAVRVQVSGTTEADYKADLDSEATITIVDPKQGPWTPERSRKQNLGYL
tara:strand:- start:223 stop:693 length:471 start_codon:yes stop_codon:yes gene_type:complete